MRFPKIAELIDELASVRNFVDDECDVRLQVNEDGSWAVRSGDSSYDRDHRGYWGASSVSPEDTKDDLRNTARYLIEQAKEQRAQSV